MAKETKIFECINTEASNNCLTVDQLIKEGKIKAQIPPNVALYHTPAIEAVNFKPTPNAKIIKRSGAYIVLGSDRPDSNRSGFGAKGSNKASTIDLVVGRMASANKGKGPGFMMNVDNSFTADAARVYISQLTNVDTNFGIAGGGVSLVQNRCAAVVLKADAVRLIGREGIKIVTGKARGAKGDSHGEPNSRGGRISQPAPPIELIAGNNIEPREVPGGKFLPGGTIDILQPIPLGKNTRDAFADLHKIIGELWSAVFNLALVQSGVNTAVGVNPIMPWIPSAVAASTPIHLSYVINSLYHTRANATMWELNYTNPAGYKYICSRNVKTT